jgi:hypothetical protein
MGWSTHKLEHFGLFSAVSTRETDRGSSPTEDGWFIAALRHEDETDVRADAEAGRSRGQGHPSATRRQFSAEEKIRIVLEGLRGEPHHSCPLMKLPRSCLRLDGS